MHVFKFIIGKQAQCDASTFGAVIFSVFEKGSFQTHALTQFPLSGFSPEGAICYAESEHLIFNQLTPRDREKNHVIFCVCVFVCVFDPKPCICVN